MIIPDVTRAIERTGVGAEHGFSLKATGKAFKILSSNLYKDKILAIVRELSTNAYDAHVAAGRAHEPFRVHLPNPLEPYFSIEDDGLGMSDEVVHSVYTTYFESTKTASNDVTGCLGLGSKSPFAYVDSFTIDTRHDGVSRTYALYLNEEGCPVVTPIGEAVPTNRPNGVCVTLPVDQSAHFGLFAKHAAEVYAHFPVPPEVTGWAGFEITTSPVVLSGNGWVLRKRTGGARAVMGTVAYPIQSDSVLTGSNRYDPRQQRLARLCAMPIDIVFPLGSLDFTAGREELSYDLARTVPTLRARLAEVVPDIQREVEARFRAVSTEVEAARLFGAMYTAGVIPHIVDEVWWNKRKIHSTTLAFHHDDYPGAEFCGLRQIWQALLSAGTTGRSPGGNTAIDVQEGARIFIDDLSRGGLMRVRRLHHEARTGIMVIRPGDHLAAIEARLAGFPLERTSSLPAQVRTTNAVPRKKASVRVLKQHNRHRGLIDAPELEETSVDVEAGGRFVVLKRGAVQGLPDGATEIFCGLYRTMIRCGRFDPDVTPFVVVPWAQRATFQDHPNWVDFAAEITAFAQGDLVRHTVWSDYADATTYRVFAKDDHRVRNTLDLLRRVSAHLPPGHDLVAFLAACSAQEKICNDTIDVRAMIDAFDLTVPTRASRDFYGEYRALFTRYPLLECLLKHCMSVGTKAPFSDIASYLARHDAV